MTTAGYSGTPLGKKLGYKAGAALWAKAMPDSVRVEIEQAVQPRFVAGPAKNLPAAHIFHTSAAKLTAELEGLRTKLTPDGMIWVSWPKKAAKVETDITEDTIRKVALPMGYVDVKVCAVDETWSGLQFRWRKG